MNEIRNESWENVGKGALLCSQNAERLLEDGWALFFAHKYLSSFLLCELSKEEMAKAFKLLEILRDGGDFQKEWRKLTGRKAHDYKLEYLNKIDDDWLLQFATRNGLSYEEIERGILRREGAQDMQEYRKKKAHRDVNFRFDSLYVGYDFDTKDWIDPQNSAFNDLSLCMQRLNEAKHLAQVLRAFLTEIGDRGVKP